MSKQAMDTEQSVEGGAAGNAEGAEVAAEPEVKDLYQFELERFRESLKKGLDVTLDRYGMTMLHSITPEEYIALRQQLKFENDKPQNWYNLGNVAAGNEEYDAAVKHFEACLKLDSGFAPALFNLGVVFERRGQLDRAKGCYEKYCEVLAGLERHDFFPVPAADKRAAEIEQIKSHVSQLGGRA